MLDRLDAAPQPLVERLLLQACPLEAHEVGDVLDVMDDVRHRAVLSEHGGVQRAPVSLLEPTALRGRSPDIVFLHSHRVRALLLEDSLKRGAQVANAGGSSVARVVGEHVEDPAPQDRRPLGHGRAQVGVAHGDDDELAVQHQVQPGRGLEQSPKLRLSRPTPPSHFGHLVRPRPEAHAYPCRRRPEGHRVNRHSSGRLRA